MCSGRFDLNVLAFHDGALPQRGTACCEAKHVATQYAAGSVGARRSVSAHSSQFNTIPWLPSCLAAVADADASNMQYATCHKHHTTRGVRCEVRWRTHSASSARSSATSPAHARRPRPCPREQRPGGPQALTAHAIAQLYAHALGCLRHKGRDARRVERSGHRRAENSVVVCAGLGRGVAVRALLLRALRETRTFARRRADAWFVETMRRVLCVCSDAAALCFLLFVCSCSAVRRRRQRSSVFTCCRPQAAGWWLGGAGGWRC